MTISQKWRARFETITALAEGSPEEYEMAFAQYLDDLAAEKEEGRREVHEQYVAILEEMRGECRQVTEELTREARALRDNPTQS